MHAAPVPLAPRRTPGFTPLAVVGTLAACVVMVAGGQIGPLTNTVALSDWFGLLRKQGVIPARDPLPGALLDAALLVLLVCWLLALRRGHDGRGLSAREVWALAGCWSAPLLIGPPLLSTDVFSYVAQGMLAARGHSPYTASPATLEWGPTVEAVPAIWLFQRSPYGPLATSIERLAVLVSGDSPLGAVIALRVLAVAGVVVIGLGVTALVSRERLPAALLLTVANPLLLLNVVSAVHFEGVMCAVMLTAVVAAVRGRPYVGLMLGCAAGAVKWPALLVVFAIALEMWHGTARHALRAEVARIAGVVVASWLVLSVMVPDGWGWLRALGTPGLGDTSIAPSAWFAHLFARVLPSAASADLSYAGRVAALGMALIVICYLLVTAPRRRLAETVGWGLLLVALLSPVLYPWYLLWGLVCLATVVHGRTTLWLAGLSAVMCTTALPGQTAASGIAITWGTVVVAIICLTGARVVPWPQGLRRASASVPSASATS
ncbi:MAG: polyprenol phosphomannose-dependent alpha 1,6 mannosyltransferase MptB [Actinomycetia bacterium]|nr:polyprenol phosphomannose-dependent alpha 1,6 mannosyltransferase MptB [Actinomycetes bacterium]